MNITCTLSGISDKKHPAQGISDISAAGFEDVMLDISKYCPPYELENIGRYNEKSADTTETLISQHPSELRNQLQPTLDICTQKNIKISTAYAPYLLRETKHTDLNGLLKELAEESIKALNNTSHFCQYLIIRPLFANIPPHEEFSANSRYYLSLADIAGQKNITILLTNQCRETGGHLVRGICSDAYAAAEWIDRLNSEAGEERFGFCLDTGVCNLCGQDMYEFTSALGTRLKAVILRDCDGHSEASLLPFTCVSNGSVQTDWLGLIRGLRKISFDGQLIMDFSDTAAGFSPLLRPQIISLAKSVADYFKWQIEIEAHLKKYSSIALFGAGNMCRNYMKCYGEKYPPLFTCDNNKSLWGTSFCGLEVKPPEALKSVPDGCGIFICNIYYREIEKQLEHMGVKNIEFFNDEYMPSFHFDRIKR